MALLNCVQPARSSPASSPYQRDEADDLFALDDFEEELKRLSAVNQELLGELHHQESAKADAAIATAAELAPADGELLEILRLENAELRTRIEELEALAAGEGEELWLERQREYEVLLEEKSEVIRGLHQKIQELQDAQESAIGSDSPPVNSVGCSSTRLGQAEEILRLKREMEEQRQQLEQDETDMMAQMRQMELTMAKERAEMARQRQEVQRLQAEMTREVENSNRDPELKERLNGLRRHQEPKPGPAGETPAGKTDQKSSGFFRRIFG